MRVSKRSGVQSLWAAKAGPGARPRRFYRDVTVEEAPGGFRVCLDGETIPTPLDAPLSVPTRRVADAIAAEWAGQGEYLDAASLPLTRLANTAIDRAAGNRRNDIVEEIIHFARFDLVCFRAGRPPGLVERQSVHWDPVLSWANTTFALDLTIARGDLAHRQDEACISRLSEVVMAMDEFSLAAMQTITTLTGSALLALQLAHGAIGGDAAWLAAHVDEDWQMEHWGADAEAAARRGIQRAEFDAAVLFLPQSV